MQPTALITQQPESMLNLRRRHEELLECVMRIHARVCEAKSIGQLIEPKAILAEIEATILKGSTP